MNRLLITLTFLLFSFSLTLNATSLGGDPNETKTACLTTELVNVSWQFSPSIVWQFEDDGVFFLLDDSQNQYSIGNWQIINETLHLDINGEAHDYILDGKCGSGAIQLNALTGTAVHLTATAANKTTAQQLAGDWQIGFSSNTVLLHFKENGDFQSNGVLNDTYNIITGKWTLSSNNERLLLYTATGELIVLEIKHLQMDELVISLVGEEKQENLFLNKL